MSDSYTLLLAAALILGGLYYAWLGLQLNRRLAASAQWPSVPGVIVHSEAKRRLTAPGAPIRDSHMYHPLIRYRYEVGGQSYENDVVELGGRLRRTRRRMQQQVAQYPRGAEVAVYYDPRDPARACLLREGPGGWMKIVAGAVFAVLGCWLYLAQAGKPL